jgi:hypothetical protein
VGLTRRDFSLKFLILMPTRLEKIMNFRGKGKASRSTGLLRQRQVPVFCLFVSVAEVEGNGHIVISGTLLAFGEEADDKYHSK